MDITAKKSCGTTTRPGLDPSATTGVVVGNRLRPQPEAFDLLTSEEKALEDRLKNIKNLKKDIKTVKVKKGDITFHKQLGTCIVQHIRIQRSGLNDDFPDADYSYPGREIIKVVVANKDGIHNVDPKELVLSTDTSNAIFGKA